MLHEQYTGFRHIKIYNLLLRHGEVSKKLSLLHLESLAEAKIEIWMDGKAEVELVDMVLR